MTEPSITMQRLGWAHRTLQEISKETYCKIGACDACRFGRCDKRNFTPAAKKAQCAIECMENLAEEYQA